MATFLVAHGAWSAGWAWKKMRSLLRVRGHELFTPTHTGLGEHGHHEEITTTLPKAKELRRVVEPMITLGKKPSLANRRLAYNRLRDRDIVGKLFDDLGPRYAKRNGGYPRILKTGFRKGDNAPLALVTLMDRVEAPAGTPEPGEEKKKTQKKETAKAA